MRVSESWLREWVSPDLDTAGLADLLTNSGLEVASVERAGPELEARIVVGRVTSITPHPDSARLRVCVVDVGRKQSLKIVCGAPNVRTGGAYPVALAGARLAGGTEISMTEVQGVRSQGMLCSAAELGLDDDAAGLMTLDTALAPGTKVDDALNLGDSVLEIELTPNRGDCMSIAGIAREVRVLTGARLRRQRAPIVTQSSRRRCQIEVADADACPRYIGRVVENIGAETQTPVWMRERLRRCGIRAVSLIVDITNYVLLELGQPMHAFDLDRIHGGIVVRKARAGERLSLLDGREATLDAQMLVIADHERPVGLAGIMGGEESSIQDGTRHILFEAAYFAPSAIAGRARALGLQTESSQRFERGVDPMLQGYATERACRLLVEIAGGDPGPLMEVASRKTLPMRRPVRLRRERLARVLGEDLPARQVRNILNRVGESCTSVSDGWKLTPPSHRFDLEAEWDLVEEVARVHGLERLPSRLPVTAGANALGRRSSADVRRAADLLVDLGYQEIVSYSFVDPDIQRLLRPEVEPVMLKNPIATHLAVMRDSLWIGLIQAARANFHRQHRRLRLFETGRTFHGRGEERRELVRVAGLITGDTEPTQWGLASRVVDFFDLKGDVEMLLGLAGASASVDFRPTTTDPALHPGQAAVIVVNGRDVGVLGRLHPRTATRLDLDQPVFVFDILSAALSPAAGFSYQKVSRFPAIRRDLALVVPEDLAAGTLLETVREAAGEELTKLELFDVYRGKGLDSGRKSIAIALTLQASSRTLNDDEVTRILDGVVGAVSRDHGAVLRA